MQTQINSKTKPVRQKYAAYEAGAILGQVMINEALAAAAAKVAKDFYDHAESIDFAGEDVETCSVPAWLKANITQEWIPSVEHLGFNLADARRELVITAGVDQHTDEVYGHVLVIVLHNDGLMFRQGRKNHQPKAGDWFIFNDRENHGVKENKGRGVFIGWTIPLEDLS